MKSALFIAVLVFGLASCLTNPTISDTPAISYATQVEPIITANCARSGCHSGNSEGPPLKNYQQVMRFTKPGDAHQSKLYKVITRLLGEQAMPPGNPLTEDQIRVVYVWIMQGAKNN